MIAIDIGIEPQARKNIAEGLGYLLADTYILYLKTHNFHWNVTGPWFATLHALFEQHYNELALAVDEIAERIRALGEFAPGSLARYAKLARIKEADTVPTAEVMIEELVAGQEAVIKTARNLLPLLEEVNDQVSLDLLTRRMQIHEKNAWMLRSLLG